MTELIYAIGDFFQFSFEILKSMGMIPNIVLIIFGIIGLAFCMKIVTTEKNILE
tara:strand:+ start:545 stop:706 length:162 start_codon:yes stop_codon:yes gene_type:complete